MMPFSVYFSRLSGAYQLDAINLLAKAEGLPDALVKKPAQPYQEASILFANL